MGVFKSVIAISTGLVILAGLIIYVFLSKQQKLPEDIYPKVQIEKTWELPNELDEISGMVFLDENRIACIQDEDGIIFIYNIKTASIEEEIPFADKADYEGIAINTTIAYTVTGDGSIYKIENYHKTPSVETFETSLSSKNDVEGLFFDRKKNQLLVAVKERDPNSEDYKGIYSFNLNTNKLEEQSVYKINMNHSIFDALEEDEPRLRFKPSGIAIHPSTGEIFSVEGTNPKMLITDTGGNPKKLFILEREDFPQPESLAFSPDEELFISTEGSPGKIFKVSYE